MNGRDIDLSDAVIVSPTDAVRGAIRIPGDKGISHRLAMLGSVSDGKTTIQNFAESADCESTLECLRCLGVQIQRDGGTVIVEGRGLHGLQPPVRQLDAGNSGTTVRLLSGILAGQSFESTFVGDDSLSRRPMKRIIDPLTRFGASLSARDGEYLPLTIRGGKLKGIDYALPIASAQVKSAVLLAGLFAEGVTTVREKEASRNHTEIALREFGADVRTNAGEGVIHVEGGKALHGGAFTVPGDISSAAFFIAAAAGLPGSLLRLTDIGVNSTRSGIIALLEQMGARIRIETKGAPGGEPVADIVVEGSELSGAEVSGKWIPHVIDEIPVLAVLATRTRDGIRIRDASELRKKESDRILAVAKNLRALGANVTEFDDGLFVAGNQKLSGGVVGSFDDHRIAMAFAVAALFASESVWIRNASCVGISFPRFFDILGALCDSRLT
jgi:3-phosphoshikimate 1-carboxyvinyltransferase